MGGDGALDEMIAQIRALGGLNAAAAIEAAPLVQEAARVTARAGQTPDGKDWPAKKDGGRALANAANAVTATASGKTITIAVQGSEVFHNWGVGKHTPRRKIIPETGDPIPPAVGAALLAGAERAFRKAVPNG